MDKEIRFFTLPNLLTLINLIAGSLAIFFASDFIIDKLYIASYLILVALVFDFFDGFAARSTNSVSNLGKELDSLADLVSFGIAPAIIIFQMIKMALSVKGLSLDLPCTTLLMLLSPVLLIIAAFLRLAKYNVNDNQKDCFLGLPVPAAAIFFSSLAILYSLDTSKSYEFVFIKLLNNGSSPLKLDLAVIGLYVYILPNVWIYIVSIFFFVIMELVNLPMFSLKFQNYGFKKNIVKYIFLFIVFVLILLLQALSLPFIILLYILFSAGIDIGNLFIKKN